MTTIRIIGTSHLAQVTAAGLFEVGHTVVLTEPFPEPLVTDPCVAGILEQHHPLVSSEPAPVVWICHDAPAQADNRVSREALYTLLEGVIPYCTASTLVLLSMQVPMGTAQWLANRLYRTYGEQHVVSLPENLRRGRGLQYFLEPDCWILGGAPEDIRQALDLLPCCAATVVVRMSWAEAELVKHARNALLAVTTALANELGTLAEAHGLDANRVLLSGVAADRRLGSLPIRYGEAITGGTLLRDVQYLAELAAGSGRNCPLIMTIPVSNGQHLMRPAHALQS